MKRLVIVLSLTVLVLGLLAGHYLSILDPLALASNQAGSRGATPEAQKPKAMSDEAHGLEVKRLQLAEKEAALNAKEQELKKLSATLESRIKEINAAKSAMEGTLQAKKQQDNERYKKMLKIYKGLKPEEAGKLLDKLDEDLAIEMLNLMDQKTATKLIPFLNQPRVLKWTRENLRGGKQLL